MKKILVVVIFYFISTSLFAQSISKGTYSVGGNISFSSTSFEESDNSQTIFTLAPNVGYFFMKNLYAGMSISINSSSFGDNSATTLGFGPSLRYYFGVNKLKPFAGLGFSYNKNSTSSSNNTNSITNFTITGGADYFITNYFALEGTINYSLLGYSSSYKYSSTSSGNIFSIMFGANYFIH